MSEPLTDEQQDYQARQAAEYGQFVANQNILVDGALAYTRGQPVPASNVERHGYVQQGLVRKVGEPEPQPEPQPELPQGDPITLNPAAVEDEPDKPHRAAHHTAKPERASAENEGA